MSILPAIRIVIVVSPEGVEEVISELRDVEITVAVVNISSGSTLKPPGDELIEYINAEVDRVYVNEVFDQEIGGLW